MFAHDLFGKPAPTFPDHALALGERLLDHELRRLAVIAFDKTLRVQQRAGIRTSAGLPQIMTRSCARLERRQADIGEQLA